MERKFKNIIHSKTFIVFLLILLMLSIGLASTYAWLTWNSTENTTLTMKIGDIADVTFTNGNDINANLTPVYNYTDGEMTSFSVKNRGISTNPIIHTVSLNITSIPDSLKDVSFKYKLVGTNNYVIEGDFSLEKNGSIITLAENLDLELGLTEYIFYLWIDGNIENNPDMINQNFKGNINVTAYETTSLSDFSYSIGQWDVNGDGSNIIQIPDGKILLTEYIGTDPIVNVYSEYILDGVSYTPIVFTDVDSFSIGTFIQNQLIEEVNFAEDILFAHIKLETENVLTFDSARALFMECSSLVRVSGLSDNITNMNSTFYMCSSFMTLTKLPNYVTNMYNTFGGCTSLVNAPKIPNLVENMEFTFYDCTSLVESPILPDSVTNLKSTFLGCEKLISMPNIPELVTDLTDTFMKCSSLENITEIPDSVTIMNRTFNSCTSLKKAPTIPNSVTSMQLTFAFCLSLTGTVTIESSMVSNAQNIFIDTVNPITVSVPLASTSFNTLDALHENNGMPSNVSLITH